MKSPPFGILAIPVFLSLAACEEPAKNVPKATVSSAAPKPTSTGPTTPAPTHTPAAASGDAMPIDTAASTVGFVGKKVTGKHKGKFEKISGSITLADGKPEGGKIVIEIDTSSVKTDSEKLDDHLESKDFFEVEKFPKATFVSSEITPPVELAKGGEQLGERRVTGELDLHGVKRTISFRAMIEVKGNAVTGKAEFYINRKDFGIVYAGKVDDPMDEEVLLEISLEASKRS